jgi:WhiB family redox-sensing transcriptional regulator
MDWRSGAACRGLDPEMFFPLGRGPAAEAQEAVAKAVCARCAALVRCRTWALTMGERAGVWGGMSPDERRAARHVLDPDRPATTARRVSARTGGSSSVAGQETAEEAQDASPRLARDLIGVQHRSWSSPLPLR